MFVTGTEVYCYESQRRKICFGINFKIERRQIHFEAHDTYFSLNEDILFIQF